MQSVTTPLLARACHAFLTLAYPQGLASIPEKRRVYYQLPLDRPVSDFLPPAAAAEGIVQGMAAPGGGGLRGWAFRLGSAHYPHLKLKLQQLDYHHDTVWVF